MRTARDSRTRRSRLTLICSCLPVSLVFIFTASECVWMMKHHHRRLHQVTTPPPAPSPGSSTTWPCIRSIRSAAEQKSDQCCATETTPAGQRNSFRHTHCILDTGSVQYAVCSMQYAVCSTQYAVCSMQCAVCSTQCAVCSMQCAVCSMQCVVCSVQCAVRSVQYAVCSMQCFFKCS